MFGFLLFDDEYDDDGKMGLGWLNCVTKPSPPGPHHLFSSSTSSYPAQSFPSFLFLFVTTPSSSSSLLPGLFFKLFFTTISFATAL